MAVEFRDEEEQALGDALSHIGETLDSFAQDEGDFRLHKLDYLATCDVGFLDLMRAIVARWKAMFDALLDLESRLVDVRDCGLDVADAKAAKRLSEHQSQSSQFVLDAVCSEFDEWLCMQTELNAAASLAEAAADKSEQLLELLCQRPPPPNYGQLIATLAQGGYIEPADSLAQASDDVAFEWLLWAECIFSQLPLRADSVANACAQFAPIDAEDVLLNCQKATLSGVLEQISEACMFIERALPRIQNIIELIRECQDTFEIARVVAGINTDQDLLELFRLHGELVDLQSAKQRLHDLLAILQNPEAAAALLEQLTTEEADLAAQVAQVCAEIAQLQARIMELEEGGVTDAEQAEHQMLLLLLGGRDDLKADIERQLASTRALLARVMAGPDALQTEIDAKCAEIANLEAEIGVGIEVVKLAMVLDVLNELESAVPTSELLETCGLLGDETAAAFEAACLAVDDPARLSEHEAAAATKGAAQETYDEKFSANQEHKLSVVFHRLEIAVALDLICDLIE